MSDLPKFVEVHEEGPREGFQIQMRSFPIEQRVAFIDALSATGVRQIQIGSLVNPAKVPAMGDTAEVAGLIERRPGVKYTALWLNRRGFERARDLPGLTIEGNLYFYASDALARRNNDRSAEEMRLDQHGFVEMYEQAGVPIESASIMCAFGCNFEGAIDPRRVLDLLPWIREITAGRGHPMPTIMLADTMGWANPAQIRRLVGAVRNAEPGLRIGLHLHDTRGLGLANVHAALEMGIDLFDSSVGGVGGCPFAGHKSGRSAGNVSTEELVFLCEELGIETSVDLDKMIEAAELAEQILGGPLSGKLMYSGSLARLRSNAQADGAGV